MTGVTFAQLIKTLTEKAVNHTRIVMVRKSDYNILHDCHNFGNKPEVNAAETWNNLPKKSKIFRKENHSKRKLKTITLKNTH